MKAKKIVTRKPFESQDYIKFLSTFHVLVRAAENGNAKAARFLATMLHSFKITQRVLDLPDAVFDSKPKMASVPKVCSIKPVGTGKAEWKSSKSLDERLAELETDLRLHPLAFDKEAHGRYWNEIVASMEILFHLAESGSAEACGFLKLKAEEFLQVGGELGWQRGCPIKY